MKGRKPINDNKKALAGTLRRSRIKNGLQVKDLVNLPSPPDHFDEWAQNIYFNTGEKLLSEGILNSLCLPLFLSYCFYCGLVHRLELSLSEAIDPEKLNATSRVYADAVRTLKSLATDFGIPPAAAGKVIVKPKMEESEFSKYLKSAGNG